MASGPTAATCALVDEREQWSCARCGRFVDGGSRHHRQLRRSGDHSTSNLLLLCGSGTTGCHGWVHANPAHSYAHGWLVHSWHEPTAVPCLTMFGWVLLDTEGNRQMLENDDAHARLTDLGLVA